LMWKSLKRYSTAPFINFVIFHLCTARAINACLTRLSAGSFNMKNVILCISEINYSYHLGVKFRWDLKLIYLHQNKSVVFVMTRLTFVMPMVPSTLAADMIESKALLYSTFLGILRFILLESLAS
jgi:hypothetical protein